MVIGSMGLLCTTIHTLAWLWNKYCRAAHVGQNISWEEKAEFSLCHIKMLPRRSGVIVIVTHPCWLYVLSSWNNREALQTVVKNTPVNNNS